jgi:hypothetical protein
VQGRARWQVHQRWTLMQWKPQRRRRVRQPGQPQLSLAPELQNFHPGNLSHTSLSL